METREGEREREEEEEEEEEEEKEREREKCMFEMGTRWNRENEWLLPPFVILLFLTGKLISIGLVVLFCFQEEFVHLPSRSEDDFSVTYQTAAL